MQEANEARLAELMSDKETSMREFRTQTRENLAQFKRVLKEQKEKIGSLSTRNRTLQQQLEEATGAKAHAVAQHLHQQELLQHFQEEAEIQSQQLGPLRSQLHLAEQRERQLEEACARLRLDLERAKIENQRRQREAATAQRRAEFQRQTEQFKEGGGFDLFGSTLSTDATDA